jgi:hypothetical protein
MIVLPVRRSVGLKAATASSRGATVPMFVLRHPSPHSLYRLTAGAKTLYARDDAHRAELEGSEF